MGSYSSFSVPSEAKRLLKEAILDLPAHKDLDSDCHKTYNLIKYEGDDQPKMPINWRLAESVAVLKGLEAMLLNILLKRKYDLDPQEIVINTDHAQLFLMSFFVLEIDPDPNGDIRPTELRELNRVHSKHFKNWDLHHQVSSNYRKAVTNIYKCHDGRYYHLHASLNPDPSLKALGLPWDRPELPIEDSWSPFIDKMAEKSAAEWDDILAEEYKQAGTICHSPAEYAETEQGRTQAGTGLFTIHAYPDSSLKPSWWPDSPATSPKRPLAGLKVVDLTRIVAGPSISRGLAELGASVMRVTGPNIADFSGLHPDLNWGKWNCHLDLKKVEDRDKFKGLVLDADVIVNGYRPGVLDKYGAGYEEIFELGKQRGRGYIYARENCFGWDGPWSHRAGWQPISDACTGVSMGFSQAMGNEKLEAVTPVLPNSDYCVGIAGSSAVIQALLLKAEHGGSYLINLALNYYNKWLTDQIGEYSPDVWEELWSKNGRERFHSIHNMNYTAPRYMEMFRKQGLFKKEFFEFRRSGALGDLLFRVPKPILQFPSGAVELKYNVGTRGNGIDQPHWPEDLNTEVVS